MLIMAALLVIAPALSIVRKQFNQRVVD